MTKQLLQNRIMELKQRLKTGKFSSDKYTKLIEQIDLLEKFFNGLFDDNQQHS